MQINKELSDQKKRQTKSVKSSKRQNVKVLLFWEIFSGTAGLTKAFQSQGWQCAPPLDIMFDEAYNLMDPGFVCVVLGLVLERRFKLIHLGFKFNT